jgi:YQGE family putative transporter
MDLAYFPLQLKVIDLVASIEKRNAFSYIFVHEFGLFVGRMVGCGLFIILATYVSDIIALRYSILIIGVVQLFSILLARRIDNKLKKYDEKVPYNPLPDEKAVSLVNAAVLE